MDNIITVKNLTKSFTVKQKEPGLRASLRSLFNTKTKTINAVKDVSFSIQQGEMLGFIGPNGAGKTTTLKMLSGILYPSNGTIEVLGFTPSDRKAEFLKQISLVMGQKNQLLWDLPALDTFNLNAETYQVPKAQYKKTLDELVDIFEIGDILQQQVRRLSLGQRMKCELVASLLHSPKILFLDEPTIGLDILTQKKVRKFIKEYNQKFGTTVILTSHYMDDVKEIAKRMIIINQGALVFDDSLQALSKKYANYKILALTLNQEVADLANTRLAQTAEVVSYDYPRLILKVAPEKIAETTALALQEFDVDDIDISEPGLDEIVTQIYSEQN